MPLCNFPRGLALAFVRMALFDLGHHNPSSRLYLGDGGVGGMEHESKGKILHDVEVGQSTTLTYITSTTRDKVLC